MKLLAASSIFYLAMINGFSQDAGHKINLTELDFLVGTWKVKVDSRLSAQGPWEKTEATSTVRKTLNGTLIEEEFNGTRENKPFLIKTLFAINSASNRYQRVFADSEHGVLIEFEGEKNEDTIRFDKTWTYSNGSAVKLRVVYHIISKDEFVIETMRMPDQVKEWDVTGRMKYMRTN